MNGDYMDHVNSLKLKIEQNSYIIPSTIVLLFTVAMIGSSSHSMRNFFLNFFQIAITALFVTMVLVILLGLKEDSKFPFLFFYSAIVLSITIGSW